MSSTATRNFDKFEEPIMKSRGIASLLGRVVEGYFHLLKFTIALCLVAMVIMVFGNVVLRYAFNSGISLSEELSRWLFVWMTFLGALVAMREHGHLGVDAVVNRLPVLGKKVCLVAGQGLMLYVCWLLFDGSWQQTVINLDVKAPTSGLSMAIFYSSGVVFAVTAALVLLYDLYRVLAGKLHEHELVMVQESEELAHVGEAHAPHGIANDTPRVVAAHGGKR